MQREFRDPTFSSALANIKSDEISEFRRKDSNFREAKSNRRGKKLNENITKVFELQNQLIELKEAVETGKLNAAAYYRQHSVLYRELMKLDPKYRSTLRILGR